MSHPSSTPRSLTARLLASLFALFIAIVGAPVAVAQPAEAPAAEAPAAVPAEAGGEQLTGDLALLQKVIESGDKEALEEYRLSRSPNSQEFLQDVDKVSQATGESSEDLITKFNEGAAKSGSDVAGDFMQKVSDPAAAAQNTMGSYAGSAQVNIGLEGEHNVSDLFASVIFSSTQANSADEVQVPLSKLKQYPAASDQVQRYGQLTNPSNDDPASTGQSLASMLEGMYTYGWLPTTMERNVGSTSGIAKALGAVSTFVLGGSNNPGGKGYFMARTGLAAGKMGVSIYGASSAVLGAVEGFTRFANPMYMLLGLDNGVTGEERATDESSGIATQIVDKILTSMGIEKATIMQLQYITIIITITLFLSVLIMALRRANQGDLVQSRGIKNYGSRAMVAIMSIPLALLLTETLETFAGSIKEATQGNVVNVTKDKALDVTNWATATNLYVPGGVNAGSADDLKPDEDKIQEINDQIDQVEPDIQAGTSYIQTIFDNLQNASQDNVMSYFNYLDNLGSDSPAAAYHVGGNGGDEFTIHNDGEELKVHGVTQPYFLSTQSVAAILKDQSDDTSSDDEKKENPADNLDVVSVDTAVGAFEISNEEEQDGAGNMYVPVKLPDDLDWDNTEQVGEVGKQVIESLLAQAESPELACDKGANSQGGDVTANDTKEQGRCAALFRQAAKMAGIDDYHQDWGIFRNQKDYVSAKQDILDHASNTGDVANAMRKLKEEGENNAADLRLTTDGSLNADARAEAKKYDRTITIDGINFMVNPNLNAMAAQWNRPQTYLYGAVPARAMAGEHKEMHNYIFGVRSMQNMDPETGKENKEMSESENSDEQSDTDARKQAMNNNAFSIAQLNRTAGRRDDRMNNQSVAFALQTTLDGGNLHYKGSETAPGEQGVGSGDIRTVYTRVAIPNTGKGDLVGKVNQMSVKWISAAILAIAALIAVFKSGLLIALWNTFRGFFKAVFTGNLASLLNYAIYLLAVKMSFIFAYVGMDLANWMSDLAGNLYEGIAGNWFGGGVNAALSGDFSPLRFFNLGGILQNAIVTIIAVVVTAILVYPFLTVNGRKANIITAIVALPLTLADTLASYMNNINSHIGQSPDRNKNAGGIGARSVSDMQNGVVGSIKNVGMAAAGGVGGVAATAIGGTVLGAAKHVVNAPATAISAAIDTPYQEDLDAANTPRPDMEGEVVGNEDSGEALPLDMLRGGGEGVPSAETQRHADTQASEPQQLGLFPEEDVKDIQTLVDEYEKTGTMPADPKKAAAVKRFMDHSTYQSPSERTETEAHSGRESVLEAGTVHIDAQNSTLTPQGNVGVDSAAAGAIGAAVGAATAKAAEKHAGDAAEEVAKRMPRHNEILTNVKDTINAGRKKASEFADKGTTYRRKEGQELKHPTPLTRDMGAFEKGLVRSQNAMVSYMKEMTQGTTQEMTKVVRATERKAISEAKAFADVVKQEVSKYKPSAGGSGSQSDRLENRRNDSAINTRQEMNERRNLDVQTRQLREMENMRRVMQDLQRQNK